jgi:uncharacterized protein YqjF (DUF2071 family)
MIGNTDHRPWPPPERSWAMAMRWHDLLFLHWPVKAAILQPMLPAGLQLDTHDGQAWLGIVPFRMSGVRPRFVPPLPGLSAFAEINVRTYVQAGGKPGVWFFSLDAASRPAVWMARWRFHLPYYFARISLQQTGGRIIYQCSRRTGGAQFAASYRPTGECYQAKRGSIDYWLTERYCLYAADRTGRVFRGEIHHVSWPLQPATVEIQSNSMTEPLGIRLPSMPPLAHFARRLDVVAWTLDSV